jgi:pimeloyl-ACP methyl ester carboxylesterase
VILEQVGAAMASQPESMRTRNLKAQREFQDAAKEAREPDFNILGKAAAPNLEAVWQRQVVPIRAWWHDHFNLDVPAIHQAVSCPCFVAQGKRDFQVKPEADAARIAKSLIDGNCTDVKFKVYDDLDHLFKPCDGRESNREMYFEDRRVCAVFIDDVVEWLKAHHR